MPWQTTSKTKIIKHQAYSLNVDSYTTTTLSQLIDEQMSNIETNLPDIITIIEADLLALESLDSSLTTEEGSTSAMLRKADVIEYDTSRGKTSGIKSRYETIRMRVARLLSNAVDDSGCGGQGMLMRG